MRSRTLYGAAAATLLVLLGLGLIYLVVMERVSVVFALGVLLAGGAAIPLIAAFRDLEDDPRAPRRRAPGED